MIIPAALEKNVSRETLEKLQLYVTTLLHWNVRINLIDRKTEIDVWQRHILDSYQLVSLIPATANTLVDYGSGAGLPALIIAAARPDLWVTMIERDQRKSVFLNEAARIMGLRNTTIHACDVVDISGQFDAISARAFTALNTLCSHAIHHLADGGICLFPKGKTHATEIEAARAEWAFDLTLTPSVTDEHARILCVSNLRRH